MADSVINPLGALICLSFYGVVIFSLNTFTLFVQIKRRKYLTHHQYPLLWILVANSLVGLLPLQLYGFKKYEVVDIRVNNGICAAWRFTYFLCTHFSIASVLIMVLERTITIYSRTKHQLFDNRKRLINYLNIAFWLVLAIFDTIPFFLRVTTTDRCPYTITAVWSLTLHCSTFLLPNSVISICYTYICYSAYTHKRKIYRFSTEGDRRNSKLEKGTNLMNLRATKQFIAIVGSYIICKLPADMYYTIEWECPQCLPTDFEPTRTWLTFFLKLLVMSHAMAVPVIFYWKSKTFRKDVQRSLGLVELEFNNGIRTNTPNT